MDDLHSIKEVASPNSGLMVSGDMVHRILADSYASKSFLAVLKLCKCVIVYRSSPSQKADMVRFVKRKIRGAVTMAIGDGGNDVSMIQEAHVGIGILGKEGSQAASFADIAVPVFRKVRRLIFWHGRSFGMRLYWYSNLFICKSSLLALGVFFFNWFNGFMCDQPIDSKLFL
mmetsp:Transcript_8672/g.6430  ORF Transcript_8672/g.6430 Transcript_8672/m.6430 type:complete len:172 (+) Transcript_8672:2067-2582(+)